MWIDAVGTPIGVQQKLMRHADVRMTMNIHGDAASQDMHEAQDKIGNSLCGPSKTAGKRQVGVCILLQEMAPQVGLEPTTLRLTASWDAANLTTLRRR